MNGRPVVRLEYEAFESMAIKEILKICNQIRLKWNGVRHIAVHHRIGQVKVEEPSIIIAISSPHRKESLEAVAFCIDQIKTTVPIWKKEWYGDEDYAWKENSEAIHFKD